MSLFDIFTGDSAKKAARQNATLYDEYEENSLDDLDSGLRRGDKALDTGAQIFGDLGSKYGKGSSLYLDALGVNGDEGVARARAAFTTSPGYGFQVDQATDAVARKGNALGVGTGNILDQVRSTAQDVANKEWGDYLTRLGGTIQPELAAESGKAGIFGAKAGLYQQDAQNRVNVRGNATSGTAASNTAAANAQMAGSSNFWGALINGVSSVAKGFSGAK